MKQLCIILTISMFLCHVSSQDTGETVKLLGRDIPILTLSDGRYDEFHEYSDFEIVGSTIIDMLTMKIAGFVNMDTVLFPDMYKIDMSTRFLTIDPLAEKFPEMSPYAYCANNPINRIDPTGMIWKDVNEADDLKNDIANRIDSYNKQNSRLERRMERAAAKGNDKRYGKLLDRRNGNNEAISQLNSSISEIDVLGNDKNNTYEFVKVSGDEGHHITKLANGNIGIQYSSTAIKLHETRHAHQYLTGNNLYFDNKNNLVPKAIGTWAIEEVSAYRLQYAYNSSSMPSSDLGSLNSINHISFQWVAGISNDKINYPYKRINNYVNYLRNKATSMYKASRISFYNKL